MKAFRNKKSAGFTLVEIMIVVLIIGILLAIAIPNFVQARERSRSKACIANLKQIDSAKQQFMMDTNTSTFVNGIQAASTTNVPSALGGTDGTKLVPTYIRVAPGCPAGGVYDEGDATTSPSCSLSASTDYGQSGTYPHWIP